MLARHSAMPASRIEQDGSLSVDAQALVARFNASPTAVTGALGAIRHAVDAAGTTPPAAASVRRHSRRRFGSYPRRFADARLPVVA